MAHALRDLLRAPDARPWDDGRRAPPDPGRARADRARRPLGIQYLWEVEHHFLEEYSHSSAPEVFLAAVQPAHAAHPPRPRHHPHRAQFNHPARTAERVAMLDLVSNGRVEFGTGESSSEAELAGFGIDPLTSASSGWRASRSPSAAWSRTPFTGVDGEFVTDAAPQRRAQAGAEAAPAAVGRVLAGATRSSSPREKGMGALTFAFIDPEEAVQWVGDYERTLAECVRARRASRSTRRWPVCSPMMCHHDEDAGDRARPRGRQLLRLLARPLLRVRRPPPRVHERVGGVPGSGARARASTPRRSRRAAGDRSAAKVAAGEHRRAARRDRHARAAARVPPPLRGGRRRPGHLRAAGRAQPPRAHHGVARAVRARGAARVHRARDEERRGGEGGAARACDRSGHGPPGRRPTSRCPTTM